MPTTTKTTEKGCNWLDQMVGQMPVLGYCWYGTASRDLGSALRTESCTEPNIKSSSRYHPSVTRGRDLRVYTPCITQTSRTPSRAVVVRVPGSDDGVVPGSAEVSSARFSQFKASCPRVREIWIYKVRLAENKHDGVPIKPRDITHSRISN
jgi:hypothetical protein